MKITAILELEANGSGQAEDEIKKMIQKARGTGWKIKDINMHYTGDEFVICELKKEAEDFQAIINRKPGEKNVDR